MRLVRSLPATSAWLLALAVACSPDGGTAPVSSKPIPVTISASLTAAQQALVSGLTAEVTGPGITTPIVANLGVSASTVNGTVNIPAGSSRLITVHAFDAAAIETYRGSTTVNVKPGTNVAVTILLDPLGGGQPITVGIGTYVLALAPANPSLALGATQTLTLTVTGSSGAPIALGAGDVQWGSANPVIASVAVDPSNPAQATIAGLLPGTTTVVATYQGTVTSVTATVTPPPVVFTQVAAGYGFTCALDIAGAAWCWGRNDHGQLGDGSTTNHAKPALVAGNPVFTKIWAGSFHACGLTAAGPAFCWGANGNGQLGDGTTTDRTMPTPVSGAHTFASLGLGVLDTCGIAAGATLFCWGYDQSGSLGVGNPDDGQTVNVKVPTALAAGGVWASVTVGQEMYCAISTSSVSSCWGVPGNWLGITTPGQMMSPSSPHSPATVFQQIATSPGLPGTQTLPFGPSGTEEFACGLAVGSSASGSLRCWGMNTSGQLGFPDESSMFQYPLPTYSAAQDWAEVATGAAFACARHAGGTIECWGKTGRGQTGTGAVGTATSLDYHPTPIASTATFTHLAVGMEHACAVRTGGAIMCWGDNTWGAIGDGTTTQRNVPTMVQP